MRIFVTGASGYIGRALCRRLAAEGHQVIALVRRTSRVEPLVEAGVETTFGDVTDRASLREGMSGADWVVHAAAELDLAAPPARMEAVNVGGTDNVAALAHKLGVGRFLSVSSVAWWGGSPDDGSEITEDSPALTPLPTRYSSTKHEAEVRVQEYARRGLAVNTVYPSLVYGPPGKKEGANALLRLLDLGRFPALIGGEKKTSWIFLDDLVEAMVRILGGAAPPGRHFILAGDVATIEEVARRVHALGGARPPRLRLSVPAARLLFRAMTPFWKLAGRRPPVPIEQLNSIARHWAFADERARRELGWRPRALDVGLPATLDYLRRDEAAHPTRRVQDTPR
ncbi:MAG: SDR family NAD(P)-dependent oxidoreductase [Thermoanaerobaculia bacterium]